MSQSSLLTSWKARRVSQSSLLTSWKATRVSQSSLLTSWKARRVSQSSLLTSWKATRVSQSSLLTSWKTTFPFSLVHVRKASVPSSVTKSMVPKTPGKRKQCNLETTHTGHVEKAKQAFRGTQSYLPPCVDVVTP